MSRRHHRRASVTKLSGFCSFYCLCALYAFVFLGTDLGPPLVPLHNSTQIIPQSINAQSPPTAAKSVSIPSSIVVSGGTRRVPCTVPCFWPSTSPSTIRYVTIDGTNITVTMSMESEVYYPNLQLMHRSPTRWIASTRFNSDVPMPYFSWAEYNIQMTPPPL